MKIFRGYKGTSLKVLIIERNDIMRNKSKAIVAALAIGFMITSTVYAATGESIGTSIKNQSYSLPSKAPIVPTDGGRVRVSTACGNYSVANRVQSVIWYNETADVWLGSCRSKFVVHSATKGNTVTKNLNLPQHTEHFAIGIYAGSCSEMRKATEKSAIGSTLASNCN